MIIDNELILANDVAHYGDTSGTAVDLVKAGGVHDNAWLFVKVGSEVFNTMDSMDIRLQTSVTSVFTVAIELLSVNVLLADMDAVDTVLIKVRIPFGVKQYIRLDTTAVGTDNTTGKLYACIVPDVNESF